MGNKVIPNQTGKHWKLSEETKRKMSLSKKGQRPWIKGRHWSDDMKEIFRRHQTGKKHSEETKRKISETRKGKRCKDNNPSWKGGVTPLKSLIRHSFKNRQWISDVFTRDNFICQRCGYSKGGILEVHHIKSFSKIIDENMITTLEEALNCEELWNINNGITLCKECHKTWPENWKLL